MVFPSQSYWKLYAITVSLIHNLPTNENTIQKDRPDSTFSACYIISYNFPEGFRKI